MSKDEDGDEIVVEFPTKGFDYDAVCEFPQKNVEYGDVDLLQSAQKTKKRRPPQTPGNPLPAQTPKVPAPKGTTTLKPANPAPVVRDQTEDQIHSVDHLPKVAQRPKPCLRRLLCPSC